jgi:hypothetical protein
MSKTFTLDKVNYISAKASNSGNACSGCIAENLGCSADSLCQALPECKNIIWIKEDPSTLPKEWFAPMPSKILTVSTTQQTIEVKQYTLILTEDQLNELYALICDSGSDELTDIAHEIEML